MGGANVDSANVVQSLVYTLLDVFDATRDLYNTLRSKERRDYERSLRSRGYPESRKLEYVDDDAYASDEGIVIDKAAVTRQFDIGFQDIGTQFAVGDVVSQTAIQSQIITLQSVIITTFLYGPTSKDPITKQLDDILAASRVAGTSSVDILAAQYQRQLPILPPTPRSTRSPAARSSRYHAPPYPVTNAITSSALSATTALPKSHHETDRTYPAKTIMGPIPSRPRAQRTDTESTTISDTTSYAESVPRATYCLYAMDLQRHPSQNLHSSITDEESPYCPYCRRELNLSPGKSWEIYKDDEGMERKFRILNRFVVKCHRNSVDGGYSCVLCSRGKSVETVCGDAKALIRHVWMDHGVGELELEEDVIEVVEGVERRRRDSMLSFTEPRKGDRRSMSVGPIRRRARRRLPEFEKEVETVEVWSPRLGRNS